MYSTEYHGSNYYASLYYGVLRGDAVDISAFERLSIRDVQYEALLLVVTNSDRHTMLHAYWLNLFGGRGSTTDILYEGVTGLGFTNLKDYYDNITGTTWPDHNSSEKAYWLKIIADNV